MLYNLLFGISYADKAFELLKEMETNGPEPNVYTYNNICRAFAEQGRLQVPFRLPNITYIPSNSLYILSIYNSRTIICICADDIYI